MNGWHVTWMIKVFKCWRIQKFVSLYLTVKMMTDDNESADEAVTVISNSEAAFMFEQCLVSLEHQKEKTLLNTAILKQLHALAAEKRINSFKQTHITSYFKKPWHNYMHQSYKKFKKWKKVGMEKKWTNKMGCLCNSDSLLIIIMWHSRRKSTFRRKNT